MSTSSESSSSDSEHSNCLKIVTKMAVRYQKKYRRLKAKHKSYRAKMRGSLHFDARPARPVQSDSLATVSESFMVEDGLPSPNGLADSSSEIKPISLDKRAPPRQSHFSDLLNQIKIFSKFPEPLVPPQPRISESNYDADGDLSSMLFKKNNPGSRKLSNFAGLFGNSSYIEVVDKIAQTDPTRPVTHCRRCHYWEIDYQETSLEELPFEKECAKLSKENRELCIQLANLREAVSIYLQPVRERLRQSSESNTISSSVSNTLIPPIENFQPSPTSSFSSTQLGYANEDMPYRQPPNTPSSTPYSYSLERMQVLEVAVIPGYSYEPFVRPKPKKENKQTQYEFKPPALSVTSQAQSNKPQLSETKGRMKDRSNSNPNKMKEEKLQRSNSEGINFVEWSIHKRTHPLPGPDSIYAGIANIPKRSLRSGKKISQTTGEVQFLHIGKLVSPKRAYSPEADSDNISMSQEPPLLDLNGIKFDGCRCQKPHTNDKQKLVMNAIPIKPNPGPGGKKKRGRPRKYLRPENMQSTTLESKIGSLICMTCGKLVTSLPNPDNQGSKTLGSQPLSETQEVSEGQQDDASSNKSNADESDDGSKCPQCLRSYHTTYRVVEDQEQEQDPQPESSKEARSVQLRTTSGGTSSPSKYQQGMLGDKPISEIEDMTFGGTPGSQIECPVFLEESQKEKEEARAPVHQNVDESPQGKQTNQGKNSDSNSNERVPKADHSECRKLACPLATLKDSYPDIRVLNGKLSLPIGEYEGEIINGAAWGVGNLTTATGDLYSGDFVFGLPHGLGRMNKADGLQLDGQFSKGTLHGWVRIKYPGSNSFKQSPSPETTQNPNMMEERIPSESDPESSEILLARKPHQNGTGIDLNASAEVIRKHRSGEVHLLTNPNVNLKAIPTLHSELEFQGDSDSDFYIGRNRRRNRKNQKKKHSKKQKKPQIQAIAVESLDGAPTDGLESPTQNPIEMTDSKQPPVPMITPASEEFEGIIVSEINMGKGQLRFQNGDEYSGDFWGDHMHGFGKMRYANGDFYYGEFQEAMREGDGIFYRKSDDSIFVGNFHKGHFHGMIVQYRPASHIAFKDGDKMFSVLPLTESMDPLLQD